MSTKKKEENNSAATSGKQEESKKNIFQKNPVAILLAGALIIAILWGVLSNQRTAKRYQKELTQLQEVHAAQLDSLHIDSGELLAQSLSWAVRSELMRENNEQVNGYFMEALKIDAVLSIRLVDHISGKNVLATNKKDEGKPETNEFILQATSVSTEIAADKNTIVAPIFGFNKQLGVLVIEKRK
jgi:hypothetical protein